MSQTILIVDDEPDILEALAEFIETLGDFKIYRAANGNDALSILSHTKADLVISDIRMPHGNGIFLIEALQEKLKSGLNFIFMTGYADLTREQALKLGAKEIFHKPFDVTALADYICKLLK